MKRIVFFCISAFLFISCSNEGEKFKAISEPEIQQIKKSMTVIIDVLEKSDFDTISIRKYLIDSEIYMDSLYSPEPNVNMDSIRKEVTKSFELKDYFPFRKQFSLSSDGSIYLNMRDLSSNLDNQNFKINNCFELRNIPLKEKQDFVEALYFLTKYHIWGADEEHHSNANIFNFSFSSENIAISSDLDYCIYFADDYHKTDHSNFKYLYEKSGLVVCRGR